MSLLDIGLLLFGGVAVPVWLLLTARRIGRRSRRERGAFWGVVAGHFLGEIIFLTVLLIPPLVWPPRVPLSLLLLALVAPPIVGFGVGALVGRR